MKKITTLFLIMLCLYSTTFLAQTDACGTYYMMKKQLEQNPSLLFDKQEFEKDMPQASLNIYDTSIFQKEEAMEITIPVVVHVVYNPANRAQNISDAQIMSQIDALNRDYHHANPDSLPRVHPFYNRIGNPDINFCLATVDDNLNPTTGITRDSTTQVEFSLGLGTAENVKFKRYNGIDGWDQMKYLNFWVCNLASPVLGYARFPWSAGADPSSDGIVVGYQSFGGIGTASGRPNARTCTHEVGHWLGLYHVWGDDTCGDDRIADTPPAIEKNFGCPTYPWRPNNRCGSDSLGEMYMDYMDYVDDNCMNSFSKGQVAIMHRTMDRERAEMVRSNRCDFNAGIRNFQNNSKLLYKIVSNATNGVYQVNLSPDLYHQQISISVVDMLGEVVYERHINTSDPIFIDISDQHAGMYFVHIKHPAFDATEMVMKLN